MGLVKDRTGDCSVGWLVVGTDCLREPSGPVLIGQLAVIVHPTEASRDDELSNSVY